MTIEDKPVNIMASNQTTGISVNLSTGEVNAGTVQFRNRIINGDMRIDQRNAGSIVSTGSGYNVDRWTLARSSTAVVSAQQITGPTQLGFQKAIELKVTTSTTLSTSQFYLLDHRIEGLNASDLNWGTSSGSSVTLSFWANPSLTGIYNVALRNTSLNRSYITETTLTANTWQYVAITIPPETSGTWFVTNAIGIFISIILGCGSSLQNTRNSWIVGTGPLSIGYIASSSSVTNFLATVNNTFKLTGVQLEKGSKATPFEFRPFAAELQLCQRYFMKTYNYDVIPGTIGFPGAIGGFSPAISYMWCFTCPTALRTNPSTITAYAAMTGTMHKYNLGGGTTDYDVTYFTNSERSILLYANANGQINNYYYVHLTIDSEL